MKRRPEETQVRVDFASPACYNGCDRLSTRGKGHAGSATGGMGMKSLLIADTTREEREQIVAESIGNIEGACDGCSPGIIEMYQDYIEGRMELREVNMAFNARYTLGMTGPDRGGCDYAAR